MTSQEDVNARLRTALAAAMDALQPFAEYAESCHMTKLHGICLDNLAYGPHFIAALAVFKQYQTLAHDI